MTQIRSCLDTIHDHPYGNLSWEHTAVEALEAYLTLTDPTPLTVGEVKKLGFRRCYDHEGKQRLYGRKFWMGEGFWWLKFDPKSLWFYGVNPQPRTAGELRQLLTRLEKL